MTELLDDFVRERVGPYRDLLWENGDISIAGLVLLDKCLKIDTYGEERTAERYTEASDDRMA